MEDSIFDLLENEIPEGQEGYFEIAKRAPQPKDDSYLESIKDYAKTFLKGGLEGISKLGRIMGPLDTGKPTSQQLEEQTELLNEYLPTDEGFVQKGLRRGLREAPSILALPSESVLGTLGRTAAAGYTGQIVEELGGPEWLQSMAELSAFIGPDLFKKLLSTGKNKEIIDFARKMGMTDEQITPLLQSESKQKWLSKLAPKRGQTKKALENTKTALDESYGIISKSEAAKNEISEVANGTLINELMSFINEMPQGVRELIEKDLGNLLNNKITGSSLINFYKDVNHYLTGKTKQLSLLKDPIKKALKSISPELGEDFEMINKLYTKYYPIEAKLRPDLVSDLISAGEALGIFGSVVTGNYPTLIGIIGEKGAKKLAQQMLINPHLQQISEKIVIAMNDNKFAVAKKLIDSLATKIQKQSPEASEQLKKLSEKELEEFLSNHQ